MKQFLLRILVMVSITACTQEKKGKTPEPLLERAIGGGCEGCEVIYESPIPFDQLGWIDTLPDFNEPGPKLVVSGIIYQDDGITPASNVVLYVYHTDQSGKYTNRYHQKGYAGRHGYIKGWIRTNEKGQFRFYTLKPASYPGSTIPAHIHPVIKEPGKNDYWIDELLFNDDPFLTEAERKKNQDRGGSGIMQLQKKDGVLYGSRDIYLGKNIPGYPAKKSASCPSHLQLSSIGGPLYCITPQPMIL
jgi:protocatechuate 3,4-dioxygenase beta subunit